MSSNANQGSHGSRSNVPCGNVSPSTMSAYGSSTSSSNIGVRPSSPAPPSPRPDAANTGYGGYLDPSYGGAQSQVGQIEAISFLVQDRRRC